MKNRTCHVLSGICYLLTMFVTPSFAQQPVIDTIRNSGSLTPFDSPARGFNSGNLVTIFGKDLASGNAAATTVPLPAILGGTRVTVSRTPARLLYVSPTQINLQIPLLPTEVEMLEFTVSTDAGTSAPFQTYRTFLGFGVFTLDGSGCGPAHVYTDLRDQPGASRLVDADNPADPSRIITIYFTGLSPITMPVPDGEPAPAKAPTLVSGDGLLYFAGLPIGSSKFIGRAPGMIGVDRADIELNPTGLSGCELPVRLGAQIAISQNFPLSIYAGGKCQETIRPDALLRWRKIISSGIEPARDAEMLEVSFTTYPTGILESYPPIPPSNLNRPYATFPPRGPSCPSSRVEKRLSAGTLTISTPGFGPKSFAPDYSSGQPTYSIPLPPGSIRPGTLRIQASGSPDIGPFETTTVIGEPIVPVPFPAGSPLPGRVVVARWSGGDPTSGVYLNGILADEALTTSRLAWNNTPAGFAALFDSFASSPQTEIQVIQYRGFPDIPAISARGMPRIRHEWTYEWHYGGFR